MPSKSWDSLKKKLESYNKKAWFPHVEEKKSSIEASKFSGIPILLGSEEWPCCKNCGQPMQLFIQLNSKHLPDEVGKPFGDGFLQVFYCTNIENQCEADCEAFFPFSISTLVRVIPLEAGISANISTSPVKDAFPEKEIVSWSAKDDYPNGEELEEMGISLTDEEDELLSEKEYPLEKDKLLGWPYWIQGVEYPECPECGKRMNLIFQIDSEDNLPYIFGDVGCSHVTQCPVHKNQMTIAWACS